eukprot:913387_1
MGMALRTVKIQILWTALMVTHGLILFVQGSDKLRNKSSIITAGYVREFERNYEANAYIPKDATQVIEKFYRPPTAFEWSPDNLFALRWKDNGDLLVKIKILDISESAKYSVYSSGKVPTSWNLKKYTRWLPHKELKNELEFVLTAKEIGSAQRMRVEVFHDHDSWYENSTSGWYADSSYLEDAMKVPDQ